MKTRNIFMALFVAALMQSCSDDAEVVEHGRIPSVDKIEFTASEVMANDALNTFGSKMFNKVVASEKDKDCVSFSPLSASICLAMVANSCDEDMEMALTSILGYSDVATLNSTCKQLMQFIVSTSNGGETLIANSCWVNDSYSFGNSWKDLMESSYYADVSLLDFADDNSKNVLDKWCSDNTKGLIPRIDRILSQDMVCVLINALYFRGEWDSKFDPGKTVPDIFNGRDYKGDVKMMKADNIYDYLKTEQFEAVSLKMGKNRMRFLLPSEGSAVDELADGDLLNETNVSAQWRKALVHLSLPRFEVRNSADVTRVLKDMGMPLGCSFDKMGIGKRGAINVKQQTYTSIDEEGAKVASLTHTGFETANPDFGDEEVTMKFDRPFVYYVQNEVTGTVLMAGVVYNL